MAITLDGTNGILSPDFEPSSSTTPTNGLFLPAANTVGLATGSTERLRIDSSGNLGLGVTPSAWWSTIKVFQGANGGALTFNSGAPETSLLSNGYYNGSNWIYSTSSYASRYAVNGYNGTHTWYNAPSGTAGAAISFTQAMTLDASGNLLVGTTSTNSFTSATIFSIKGLAVAWNDAQYIGMPYNAGTGYYNGLYLNAGTRETNIRAIADDGASKITFSTGITAVERARIDGSGNLLVGITSNSGVRCYVKGEGSTGGTWSIYATNSSGTTQFGLRNDNYLYAPSVGNYGTTGTTVVVNGNYLGYLSSSIRFKKDIVDYDKGLTEILTLRPVYYKSKNPNPDGQYDEQRYAGLIAEEIADLGFDEFVLNGPDGKINSIQYGNMVALCIKAIQELTARLEALENK